MIPSKPFNKFQEIEKVKEILEIPNLRQIQRYALIEYLKSLEEEDGNRITNKKAGKTNNKRGTYRDKERFV